MVCVEGRRGLRNVRGAKSKPCARLQHESNQLLIKHVGFVVSSTHITSLHALLLAHHINRTV